MEFPPMTINRRDGSEFTLQPRPPRSFAARFDLAAELSRSPLGAQAMRVNCAALGMALTGQHPPDEPGSAMPAYRNDGDLMAYGGSVIETLSVKWQAAPDQAFWLSCIALGQLLCSTLPSAEGVKEKTDFTSQREGD